MASNKQAESKQPAAVPVQQAAAGSLQARDPYDLFAELDRWFGAPLAAGWPRLFGGRWPTWSEARSPWAERSPRVDIADGDKEIVVKAELPGVDRNDLEVTLTESSIRINAKTRSEQELKEDDYVRREISRGEFTRTLPLPAAVRTEQARASFKDGVLTVTLQKAAASQRRSIKID